MKLLVSGVAVLTLAAMSAGQTYQVQFGTETTVTEGGNGSSKIVLLAVKLMTNGGRRRSTVVSLVDLGVAGPQKHTYGPCWPLFKGPVSPGSRLDFELAYFVLDKDHNPEDLKKMLVDEFQKSMAMAPSDPQDAALKTAINKGGDAGITEIDRFLSRQNGFVGAVKASAASDGGGHVSCDVFVSSTSRNISRGPNKADEAIQFGTASGLRIGTRPQIGAATD